MLIVPLALGLPLYGLAFLGVYACIISMRIRAANVALNGLSGQPDIEVSVACNGVKAARHLATKGGSL